MIFCPAKKIIFGSIEKTVSAKHGFWCQQNWLLSVFSCMPFPSGATHWAQTRSICVKHTYIYLGKIWSISMQALNRGVAMYDDVRLTFLCHFWLHVKMFMPLCQLETQRTAQFTPARKLNLRHFETKRVRPSAIFAEQWPCEEVFEHELSCVRTVACSVHNPTSQQPGNSGAWAQWDSVANLKIRKI